MALETTSRLVYCSHHTAASPLYPNYTYFMSDNKENDSAPKKKGAKKSASKNSTYTELDNTLMIQVLRDEKLKGNQSDSGWKSSVWTTVLDELISKGSNVGGVKTADKVADHYQHVSFSFMPT